MKEAEEFLFIIASLRAVEVGVLLRHHYRAQRFELDRSRTVPEPEDVGNSRKGIVRSLSVRRASGRGGRGSGRGHSCRGGRANGRGRYKQLSP